MTPPAAPASTSPTSPIPAATSGGALQIEALTVTYTGGARAVRGISMAVAPGQCLALVGESGCGKSTVANAVLGLLPRTAHLSGSVEIDGQQVVGAPEATLRHLRGLRVGLVAQDPTRSFDPLLAVGTSVAEAWRVHRQRPPRDGIDDALAALGIPQARTRARKRPHEWSGGMLQRAAIVAAGAHTPPLIIADEPTSALDADRADAVLEALRTTGAGILLISHDLELVGRHSDTVSVMYAGRLVETGPAARVLQSPRHPYTAALLAATPRPGHGLPVPLPGTPPPLDQDLPGCAFAPRCPAVLPECGTRQPVLRDRVACHRQEAS
jgi:oligopeptide/dipeptide ABC transporter ATP-binding protein